MLLARLLKLLDELVVVGRCSGVELGAQLAQVKRHHAHRDAVFEHGEGNHLVGFAGDGVEQIAADERLRADEKRKKLMVCASRQTCRASEKLFNETQLEHEFTLCCSTQQAPL